MSARSFLLPHIVPALLVALLVSVPIPAQAHDIPNERVDRAIQVEIEPRQIWVHYEISLTEWTLYQDLKRLSPELDAAPGTDWIGRYAKLIGPLNAKGLIGTVDGIELSWTLDHHEIDFEAHPILRFHFQASIPDQGRLRLIDTNYASSFGTSRLAIRSNPGRQLRNYEGPGELAEVPEVPVWLLSDEEERRTREVTVDFEIDRNSLDSPHPPSNSDSNAENRLIPTPGRHNQENPLTRLFWETPGRASPFLLIMSFILGVAHAIQPGHGKSVVVGSSLQGPRPVRRSLLLAGSAAVTHLLVAVALAIGLIAFMPSGVDRVDTSITRVVGLILASIGAWRVGSNLNGIPANAPGERVPVTSSRDALLAGVSLGAIPCWDAVLLLAIAWVVGQFVLGLMLLVAFSLGTSAMLLSIALAAGWLRGLALRFARSDRIERSIGLLGGLLLAGVGIFLLIR